MELLVVNSQLGDRDALRELIGHWQPRLAGFVGSMLDNRAQADAAIQEAWISVLRSLPNLQDPSRFTAWLFTIARRSVLDRLREAYRHQPEVFVPEIPDEPDEAALPEELVGDRLAVATAVSELGPVEREVIWLVHMEDRSLREVAVITSSKLGTVKSRHHRALRRLRAVLEAKGYSR